MAGTTAPIAPNVFFASLVRWGEWIALVGFLVLIVIIPLIGKWLKKSDTRTEFYSARASFWTIISGLVLIVVGGLGGTVVQVILAVRN